VEDHVPATDAFRLRFVAADLSPGSVVEAAVDDVEIWGEEPTAAFGPLPAPRSALLPNVPNPFNPSTELRFRLDAPGRVQLSVHDVAGRKVATVLDEVRPAGEHAVRWTARDRRGRPLASGLYLVRMVSPGGVDRSKIVLAK
jgi:hypothetical protein